MGILFWRNKTLALEVGAQGPMKKAKKS